MHFVSLKIKVKKYSVHTQKKFKTYKEYFGMPLGNQDKTKAIIRIKENQSF